MNHIAAIIQTQSTNFGFYTGGGYGGYGYCTDTLCDIANTFLYLINGVGVPLLFAVSFIVFLYGVAQTYIFSHGDAEAVGKGHKAILWGIIGFAVMISVWGLVNIVANTFHLQGNYYAPDLPFSPGTGVGPSSSGGSSLSAEQQSRIQSAVQTWAQQTH